MVQGSCAGPWRQVMRNSLLFWASVSTTRADKLQQEIVGNLNQLIEHADASTPHAASTTVVPLLQRGKSSQTLLMHGDPGPDAAMASHTYHLRSDATALLGTDAVTGTYLLQESFLHMDSWENQEYPVLKLGEHDKPFAFGVLLTCILLILLSVARQKSHGSKPQALTNQSSPQAESEKSGEPSPLLSTSILSNPSSSSEPTVPSSISSKEEQTPLLEVTTRNSIFAAVTAALPCLLDGVQFCVASGVAMKLDPKEKWSLAIRSLVVGSFQVGQVLTTFIVPSVVNRIGLKKALQLVASGQAFAFFILAVAPRSVEVLIGARLLAGICFGQSVAPAYIAEMIPAEQRGAAESWVEIFTNLGSLSAMVLIVLFWDLPVRHLWLCSLMGSIIVTLMLIWLPSDNQASVTSSTTPHAEEYLPETRAAKKGLYIACALAALQQSTGCEALYGYAAQIANDAGFAKPLMFGIVLAALSLSCNLLSGTVVDCAGRRPLLIGGLLGMSVAWAAASAGLIAKAGPYMVLGAVLTYELIFAMTLGPGFFVVASEVLPRSYRTRGLSIALLVSRITASLFVLTFELKNFLLLLNGTFALYSVFMLAGAAFVYFQIPETACKSIDEIQSELDSNTADSS